MKNLRTFSMLALVAAMLFASAADAAPTLKVRIGDGDWDAATVRPNQPVDLHVYLAEIDGSVAGVEYKLDLPAGLFVMSSSFAFPGALDLGSSSNGVAVGFGACYPIFQVTGSDDDLLVQTVTVFALGHFDLAPIVISPFGGGGDTPTAPRFATCDSQLFDLAVDSAQISSTTVDNDTESWGAIKALY